MQTKETILEKIEELQKIINYYKTKKEKTDVSAFADFYGYRQHIAEEHLSVLKWVLKEKQSFIFHWENLKWLQLNKDSLL